jgi:hypothetical protein
MAAPVSKRGSVDGPVVVSKPKRTSYTRTTVDQLE